MSNGSELSNAPKYVQLAVDLIQLLEENKIEPDIAIKALTIALKDQENKIKNGLN